MPGVREAGKKLSRLQQLNVSNSFEVGQYEPIVEAITEPQVLLWDCNYDAAE
jgi:hypothetical protein